ncbi:MAG: hypothetical protein GX887_06025, partial [Firmicutes bacterium]|nr:hypothetical protein [Bacillota bacterium]
LCPYIKSVGDCVTVIHNCGLSDGNCYKVCPRTVTDYDLLTREFIGQSDDVVLGSYKEYCQARALDKRYQKPGQYGGVVTALIAFALEQKSSNAALLTASDGLYPNWVLTRNETEVIRSAGSKYGVCPGLSGLNQAIRRGNTKIAVVGRPCQITSLRKMLHYGTLEGRNGINLLIGLFCFWGLDYQFYRMLKESKGIGRIDRADIPREEGLILDTDQGQVSLTLEETRKYVRQGCHSCFDPTSELADISVGSTESDPQWSTLLVRTEAGVELVERAKALNVIETRPCPDLIARELWEAVLNKKRRVLGGTTDDGLAINNKYIRITEESHRQIMENGGIAT